MTFNPDNVGKAIEITDYFAGGTQKRQAAETTSTGCSQCQTCSNCGTCDCSIGGVLLANAHNQSVASLNAALIANLKNS